MSGRKPREREQYIIRMEDGQLVEVTREVYLCIHQADRRERYLEERDRMHNCCSFCSLNSIDDTDASLDGYGVIADPQSDVYEHVMEELRKKQLHEAINRLAPDKQKIIYELYFNGVSARQLSKEMHIARNTLAARKKSILQELKSFLSEIEEI